MIALLHAAILGIIQGLTEFLPVSSSGHLILARDLFGWHMLSNPHLNKVFDVALHAGTFVSLVIYFREDLVRLARAFAVSLVRGIGGDVDRRLAWLMVIGTIPGALVGVFLENLVENVLGAPKLIAVQLIVFAFVLYAADRLSRRTRPLDQVSWLDGILVGAAQALALAPGVSRSGITITMGLALGLKREAAARFSFLLSIPIIGGAALYAFAGVFLHHTGLPAGSEGMFAVGALTSAVSGYLCIKYFLNYLRTRSLNVFVVYRIAFGAALLAFYTLGR